MVNLPSTSVSIIGESPGEPCRDDARSGDRLVVVVPERAVREERMTVVAEETDFAGNDAARGDFSHCEARTVRVTMLSADAGLIGVCTRAGHRLRKHDVAVMPLEVIVDQQTAAETATFSRVIQEGDVVVGTKAHQVVDGVGAFASDRVDDVGELRSDVRQDRQKRSSWLPMMMNIQ